MVAEKKWLVWFISDVLWVETCVAICLNSKFTQISVSPLTHRKEHKDEKGNEMYVVTATKLSLLLIRLLISLLIKWLNNRLPGRFHWDMNPTEENQKPKKKRKHSQIYYVIIGFQIYDTFDQPFIIMDECSHFFRCLSFNEFDEKSIHWRRCGSRIESQPSLGC